jgi:WD40 repeat protein
VSYGPQGNYRDMAFSPDGRWLAACGDSASVWLIDTSPAKQHRELELDDRAHGLRFWPDGRSVGVVTPSLNGDIRVWSLETMKPQATIHGKYQSFDVAPDGQRVAVGTECGGVSVLDLFGQTQLRTMSRALSDRALRFAPDGQTLAWSNRTGLNVWDLTCREPEIFGLSEWGSDPAFLHEGKTLARLEKDGAVLTDRVSGRVIATVETFPRPNAISPDGKLIAAIDYERGKVNFFEVATKRVVGVAAGRRCLRVLSGRAEIRHGGRKRTCRGLRRGRLV